MARTRTITVVLLALLSLTAGGAVAGASTRSSGTPGSPRAEKTVELGDSRLKVEINATDGDAGLQQFIDGDPWKRMRIIDPDGETIFEAGPGGDVRKYGLTELFTESSEPPFTEFPIEKFKELFPEGKYRFRGRSIEGDRLIGAAELTHDFPDGPVITAPTAGRTVAPGALTVTWNDVTTPAGIVIDAYQVLVVQEDPVLRVFSVDLPASADRVTVPAEFLQPDTTYKVEVLAIEVGGNQTLTELEFSVA